MKNQWGTFEGAAERLEEQRTWLREHSITTSHSCVDWPFYTTQEGYGRLGAGSERFAHRLALIWAQGPPPDRERRFALHSCDNPPCVNVHHLRWGTHAENMADKMARGRHVPPRGERNGQAKLTADGVRSIRVQLAEGVSREEVAEGFGVSKSCIVDIDLGRRWAHLD